MSKGRLFRRVSQLQPASEANDGPSALDKARAFHPDIALLDIGLPVMDGYELARRMREQRAVYLVAVTGYGQDSDRARARDEGERVGADRHLAAVAADPHGRALGVVLAADQLVGVRDPVDVGDAGQRAQVEVVEGVDVADQADDRADDALGHEGLTSHALDLVDDVGDLLVGGSGGHDDDHGVPLSQGWCPGHVVGAVHAQRPAAVAGGVGGQAVRTARTGAPGGYPKT